MIDRLKLAFPNFSHLQESPLESGGIIYSWQVTAFDHTGEPIGSGFSKDLSSARKIAISEFIERNFVLNAKKSSERLNWKLDQFPTACGFASGFDPLNTKIRSIGEAIERWSLSKWLDENCPLEKECFPQWRTDSKILLRDFENVHAFKKEFLFLTDNMTVPFYLCAVVGLTKKGAFMGSAVRSGFDDSLAHSILEAHRHLLISQQERNFELYPFNRIKYFSTNRNAAEALVFQNRTSDWTTPVIEFQKSYQNDLFCITRTIFKDWIPWERGPLDRMLY